MPTKLIADVTEFLLNRGLITKDGDRFFYREKATYVGRDSLMATRHGINWRLKVIDQLDHMSNTDIVFTNPVMISENDFEVIANSIMRFINQFRKTTAPSKSEILCLDSSGYIINAKNTDGSSDKFFFSNEGYQRPDGELGTNWYWSSSVDKNNSDYAFIFNGGYGYVYNDYRNNYLQVRCVAGVGSH